MNIKGFRPGKVPAAHVRKLYGRDLMGEIVQETLNETTQQALDQAQIRAAAPADLKLASDIDKVVAGQADLAFEMEVEIMPDFEPVDPTTLSLKRPVYEASDADIDEALKGLLEQFRTYEKKGGKSPKAAKDDMVVIDFTGRVDGEAFEGGSATDAEVVIGSNRFIPGFEEQLEGAKTGESRTLTVTFPEDYGAAHLAGKPAEFEVTVKEIKAAKAGEADAAFAERIGFESIDAAAQCAQGPTRPGLRRDEPLPAEAAPARRAGRRPRLPAAGEDGGERVPLDLEPDRGRPRPGRSLRRRTPTSRKRSSRPNTARSPSGACGWAWCWPRSAAAPG